MAAFGTDAHAAANMGQSCPIQVNLTEYLLSDIAENAVSSSYQPGQLTMVLDWHFAKLAGICEETVYRLLARRELEGIKLGRAWRLPVQQLYGERGTEEQIIGEWEN